MIPSKFQYKRAKSVTDALSMLSNDAKFLAGGHSLLPAMKLRLNQPDTLIDISRIEELKEIKDEGDHIIIGAAATHHDVAYSTIVKEACSMMASGAEQIGDIQVRNAGTIGGSLAHADPAADWPALVIAAEATIRVQGPDGSRDIPAASYFTGFYETALADNEMITEIHVPKLSAGSSSVYVKFVQPASRFAIVGCAVVNNADAGEVGNIKVAITGVSEMAYRAHAVEDELMGQVLSEESIERAAARATDHVDILSDHYASEKYRKHLAQVYVKKALETIK